MGTVVGTPTLDRVRAGSPLSSHTTAKPRPDALRSQARPTNASRQAHLEQPDQDRTDATHEASRHPSVSSRRICARTDRPFGDRFSSACEESVLAVRRDLYACYERIRDFELARVDLEAAIARYMNDSTSRRPHGVTAGLEAFSQRRTLRPSAGALR